MALLGTYLYAGISLQLVTLYTFILLMLAFYLAASIALTGYDLWADSTTASRRVKLGKGSEEKDFTNSLENISSRLGALK